jgi:hypothetical protein
MVFWGIFRNPETGRREYRRTEVYKAFKWTRQEVARLYFFFKKQVSRSRGAVFAFHNDRLYLDEKDPLLKFTEPLDLGSYSAWRLRRSRLGLH